MIEYDKYFWQYVMPEPNSGCWLWMGACINTGYGKFWAGHGKSRLAHRFSYELHKGRIPHGLVVDHKCNVRACVNPDHLRAVTQRVNSLVYGPCAANSRKTHCAHGHELSGSNAYARPGRTERRCRKCHATQEKGRKQRRGLVAA